MPHARGLQAPLHLFIQIRTGRTLCEYTTGYSFRARVWCISQYPAGVPSRGPLSIRVCCFLDLLPTRAPYVFSSRAQFLCTITGSSSSRCCCRISRALPSAPCWPPVAGTRGVLPVRAVRACRRARGAAAAGGAAHGAGEGRCAAGSGWSGYWSCRREWERRARGARCSDQRAAYAASRLAAGGVRVARRAARLAACAVARVRSAGRRQVCSELRARRRRRRLLQPLSPRRLAHLTFQTNWHASAFAKYCCNFG